MAKFHIEYTDEIISSNSGLILTGSVVNSSTFKQSIQALNIQPDAEISDYDIIKSYIGILSLGKNAYESIEPYRSDELFKKSLEIKCVPSCSTLRQRMEQLSQVNIERIIESFNTEIIKLYGVLHTCLDTEYIPIDFDVSPFDNSRSQKEGVSNTYKNVMGFAPMLTYIGETGFMINNEMREGKAHSNCEGTDIYIRNTINYARRLTTQPLLCRFDSGNDSIKNIDVINGFEGVDYIIKKNFRRENRQCYIDFAKNEGCDIEKPRDGKTIYFHSKLVKLSLKDEKGKEIKQVESRLVVRMVERSIKANGQRLLIPEQDIDAWYTCLVESTFTPKNIEELYKDHGTSEQFHSEFKTDMDMERLPSGKFETNSLILKLGMIAFNILRAIGHETLNSGKLIRKRPVKRVRIRKVLQDIMYMACKFMIKYRRLTIQFGRYNQYANPFIYAHTKFELTT